MAIIPFAVKQALRTLSKGALGLGSLGVAASALSPNESIATTEQETQELRRLQGLRRMPPPAPTTAIPREEPVQIGVLPDSTPVYRIGSMFTDRLSPGQGLRPISAPTMPSPQISSPFQAPVSMSAVADFPNPLPRIAEDLTKNYLRDARFIMNDRTINSRAKARYLSALHNQYAFALTAAKEAAKATPEQAVVNLSRFLDVVNKQQRLAEIPERRALNRLRAENLLSQIQARETRLPLEQGLSNLRALRLQQQVTGQTPQLLYEQQRAKASLLDQALQRFYTGKKGEELATRPQVSSLAASIYASIPETNDPTQNMQYANQAVELANLLSSNQVVRKGVAETLGATLGGAAGAGVGFSTSKFLRDLLTKVPILGRFSTSVLRALPFLSGLGGAVLGEAMVPEVTVAPPSPDTLGVLDRPGLPGALPYLFYGVSPGRVTLGPGGQLYDLSAAERARAEQLLRGLLTPRN